MTREGAIYIYYTPDNIIRVGVDLGNISHPLSRCVWIKGGHVKNPWEWFYTKVRTEDCGLVKATTHIYIYIYHIHMYCESSARGILPQTSYT